MNELAIKVEHVSKEYRLGAIGGATLKGEVQSKIARMLNQEDPNLKIGQTAHDKNEKFMALNDVSFSVKKGETIGIIGHNGAGKSTILKLICRVTAPSKGSIYMNGRLTSMLEIGTGFHPELTGRENVYLNGAILGMTKAEISKKFDQIVEFSEVGKFIDTPVKRYSSGMKVKLAFAVASHLDSEIMIMDEVLAVGDVAFQNKCIERMKVVAEQEGRTILYVSHNMATVKKLCDRCLVLSQGKKIYDGNTEDAISLYMKEDLPNTTYFDTMQFKRNHKCNLRHLIKSIELLNVTENQFGYGERFKFRMRWVSTKDTEVVKMKAVLFTADMEAVGIILAGELEKKVGENYVDYFFDTKYLVPGKYYLDLKLYDEDKNGNVVYYDQCRGMNFSIIHNEQSIHLKHWFADWGNAVLPCINKCE